MELEGYFDSSEHIENTNKNAHDEMHEHQEPIDVESDPLIDLATDIANDTEDDMAHDLQRDSMDDILDDEVHDVGEEPMHDMVREEADVRSMNAIRHAFIKMQSDWNSSNCPISCQDSTMRHLFDGLNPEDPVEVEPKFGAIFRRMDAEWKGELDEGQVVNTWTKLIKMYKNRGMVEPKRYRMCIGSTEENMHEAIILEPSNEDMYEGAKVVNCTCHPPKMK